MRTKLLVLLLLLILPTVSSAESYLATCPTEGRLVLDAVGGCSSVDREKFPAVYTVCCGSKSGNQTPVITEAPMKLRVSQHYVASYVEEDGTPVEESIFYPTESRAIYWVELVGSLHGQRLRWEFYDPDGGLYETIDDEAESNFRWAWIDIASEAPSRNPGTWRVNFYVDDELMAQDSFIILSSGPSPPETGWNPAVPVVVVVLAGLFVWWRRRKRPPTISVPPTA